MENASLNRSNQTQVHGCVTGRGQEATTKPLPDTFLANSNERLIERTCQILSVANRLETVSDRIFGPQPQSATSNPPSGIPHCDTAALESTFSNLDAVIDRLLRALERVESI